MLSEFYLNLRGSKSTKNYFKYFLFALAKVKTLRIFAPRILEEDLIFLLEKSNKELRNEKNISAIKKEEKK